MATDDWVSKRVGIALAANPLAQPETVKALEALLRNRLGERLLRPSELTEVSNELISSLIQPAETLTEDET